PLEQLLQVADVVTLHVALTDQTRHLVNAQRLSVMKPKAVLLNTARGELVDEAALVEAVTLQRIAGAAIDVFAQEPLPADAPLRKLDHVILTPHLAASTAEAQERVGVEIGTAVRDALLHGDFSTAVNVPGITADVLRRLGPLLDLARRLGRLAVALADGPVRAVEVAYGGRDEGARRPGSTSAATTSRGARPATRRSPPSRWISRWPTGCWGNWRGCRTCCRCGWRGWATSRHRQRGCSRRQPCEWGLRAECPARSRL